MSSVLIVSHIADLDGVASAVLLTAYFKEFRGILPNVVFADYENAQEKVLSNSDFADEIWICDLSWKENNIDSIDKLKSIKIFFFDHHSSSRKCFEHWANSASIFFDDSGKMCTADIIYAYLSSLSESTELPPPTEDFLKLMAPIVSATHSRDLWIKDDPNGCAISCVIDDLGAEHVFFELIKNPEKIHISNFPKQWTDSVSKFEEKLNLSYDMAQKTLLTEVVNGVNVCACFALGAISETGERILKEKGPSLIGFIDLNRKEISFRTNEETIEIVGFGVNKIASFIHQNGGGHPCAAGAACSSKHFTEGPIALLNDMLKCVKNQQLIKK